MRKNNYYKYIPTYCAASVFDVDYSKLYELGKRIILTDLDNTLISYRENCASIKLLKLREELVKLGFKIYIVSNNNAKRIECFKKTFQIDGYLVNAKKPSPKRINKFIEDNNINKESVIFIGDQLVTDILMAGNASLDSILVSTIDKKSQKWYTKINRAREKRIIRRIGKFDVLMSEKINNTVNRGKTNE